MSTVTVGPLRLADADVYVHADADFAAVAEWAFRDLHVDERSVPAAVEHQFDVRHRARPWVHWGVWRDNQPCETSLDEGYVLFHLQWEFNRVVLERSDATVHAAAVEIDGRCVVLCGTSMSGKTTLAGWMASHGARYVADEIVTLRDGLALPYHRPLGLRHGGPLEPMFSIPDHLDRRFEGYELLVPVSTLDGGSLVATPHPVGAVIFPQYAHLADTRLVTMLRSEALTRLCDSSPGIARHGRAVFVGLTEVVNRVPTAELQMSSLREADHAIRALLDGVEAAR